jgi:hypothetical protein
MNKSAKAWKEFEKAVNLLINNTCTYDDEKYTNNLIEIAEKNGIKYWYISKGNKIVITDSYEPMAYYFSGLAIHGISVECRNFHDIIAYRPINKERKKK